MSCSGMPRYLIVCATESELRAVFDIFCSRGQPPLPQQTGTGADWNTGKALLTPLVCGVGPVAAALNAGSVLGKNNASSWAGVLNFGLAGSYAPERAPVGRLVLASEECFPEYGIWREETAACASANTGPGRTRGKAVSTARLLPAVPPLRQAGPEPLAFAQMELPSGPVFTRLGLDPLQSLGRMGLNCDAAGVWRQGTSVTVSGVSGDRARARRMARICGGLTENMEGFSLALASAAHGLPFAEIRAVSNAAGTRPPESWDIPSAYRSLGQAAAALFANLAAH